MTLSFQPHIIVGGLLTSLLACTPLSAQSLTRSEIQLAGLEQKPKLNIHLLRLISGRGEVERYEPADAGTQPPPNSEYVEEELAPGTRLYRYTLSNSDSDPLFIKLSARVQVPLERFAWWNGYANQVSQRFEGDSLLTMWFPVNAAIGGGKAFLLGLHPGEVYSRIESRYDKVAKELKLEFPLVLDPGASRTVSIVVSTCPARYGGRDVVQHYYDLFPEWYTPTPEMHPAVLSTQSTYLFWKPQNYKQPVSPDLIRRFSGGAGGWEWCYKPFVRGGDWAITDELSIGYRGHTKESLEESRRDIRTRFDNAAQVGVAAMYYLNVLWAEQSLMKEHFPEALANPEYDLRCWGGTALRGLYPWKNRYAALFLQSIRDIAEQFPSTRGIAWDSCFGHMRVPASVAGVNETVEKSFDRGSIFALNGVGYTHLLDLNRSLSSDGYQRANAVNLKLVAPYFLGVRSDSALYEGTPVEDPRRLIRFESLRARLGSPKALSWHKNLIPSRLRWVKWDKLTREDGVEAYRQVQEDALFLSYYWGAIPSPGMPTLGIRRTFEAIPELITLTRLGWQPSPAADCPEPFLIARYGSGPGAELVIINPEFEARDAELFLPATHWNGKIPYLARKDGEPLQQTMTAEGVRLTLKTSPRSITILRVLGEGTPSTGSVALTTEGETPAGAPATWHLKADGRLPWPSRFVVPAEYEAPESPTPNIVASTSGRELKVAAAATNSFTITAQPAITSNKDFVGLREWFGDKPQAAVEATTPDTENATQRVGAWFMASNIDDGKETPPPKRKILLALQADGKPSIIAKGDTITLSAPTREALEEATLFFLRQMDLAFPECGVIPPSSDSEMARLQLPGTVLEPKPQNDFILRPTLAERMKKAFRPLKEQ